MVHGDGVDGPFRNKGWSPGTGLMVHLGTTNGPRNEVKKSRVPRDGDNRPLAPSGC